MFELKNIFKLFLSSAKYSGIAPKENQIIISVKDFLQSTILIYGIVSISISSCIYRYRFWNIEPKGLFLFYLFETIEILGSVIMLITHKSYLQKNKWRFFYENMKLSEISIQGQNITSLLFLIFILEYLISVIEYISILLNNSTSSTSYRNIWNLISFVSPTFYQFFLLILENFLIMSILEIRFKLINARHKLNNLEEHLTVELLGKVNKLIFQAYKQIAALKELFEYQILLILFQWNIHVLIGLLNIMMLIKNEKLIFFQTTTVESVLTMGLYYIGLIFIVPCIVVAICDMVISEANKLLEKCQELEENYDNNSCEYQQLESMERFLKNGSIQFSAAKFVTIRRITILLSIESATTYFIAFLQFHRQ